jgi:hypothetical protein
MRDADASVVMVEEDVGFCERTLNADGQDYYVEFYVRRLDGKIDATSCRHMYCMIHTPYDTWYVVFPYPY